MEVKKEFEEFVRSKKSTAPIYTVGNKDGRTTLPYAFTEQDIYVNDSNRMRISN